MSSHDRSVLAALSNTPPRAATAGAGVPHGAAVALAMAAGVSFSINLRNLVATFLSKAQPGGKYITSFEDGDDESRLALGAPPGGPGGGVGSYITIAPESTDIGIVFGPNQAAVDFVSGKPNLAMTGAIDGNGNYAPAPTTCWRIRDQLVAPYPPPRYRLQRTKDEWMGVTPVANGILRLYISSEAVLTT